MRRTCHPFAVPGHSHVDLCCVIGMLYPRIFPTVWSTARTQSTFAAALRVTPSSSARIHDLLFRPDIELIISRPMLPPLSFPSSYKSFAAPARSFLFFFFSSTSLPGVCDLIWITHALTPQLVSGSSARYLVFAQIAKFASSGVALQPEISRHMPAAGEPENSVRL